MRPVCRQSHTTTPPAFSLGQIYHSTHSPGVVVDPAQDCDVRTAGPFTTGGRNHQRIIPTPPTRRAWVSFACPGEIAGSPRRVAGKVVGGGGRSLASKMPVCAEADNYREDSEMQAGYTP